MLGILPFGIYLLAQVAAVVKLRGRVRLMSLIPALPMAGVAYVTIYAFRQESNLWWFLLMLASPAAALVIWVVWLAPARKNRDA